MVWVCFALLFSAFVCTVVYTGIKSSNKQVIQRECSFSHAFLSLYPFTWKMLVLGNQQIPSPCFILQMTVVYKWLLQPLSITCLSVLIQQKDSKRDNVKGLQALRDKQIALMPMFPFSFNLLTATNIFKHR